MRGQVLGRTIPKQKKFPVTRRFSPKIKIAIFARARSARADFENRDFFDLDFRQKTSILCNFRSEFSQNMIIWIALDDLQHLILSKTPTGGLKK